MPRRTNDEYGSSRAVPSLRKALGERLRTLRRERGLSQDGLGARAGLSGKFIGEVERGQKSVSIDSLYHVATALKLPLRTVIDVPAANKGRAPGSDALAVLPLLKARDSGQLAAAHRALRAILAGNGTRSRR